MTSLLKARGLRLHGRLQATDLSVEPAQLVAVVGPNGGGKTSLLRTIADVDGQADMLEVNGEAVKAIPPARRPALLTFLPASREAVWPISVHDTIGLGLHVPDPERVRELIALLELGSLAHRPVNSLSTGERARVLLARALAPSPRLLLLDEPLSNLDPYWVLRIIEILQQEVRQKKASALVSLHDLNQVEAFDRLLLVDRGQVLLDATPAEALANATLHQCFGIIPDGGKWLIRPPADPRSSR